jgi:hypothetical protein
MQAAFVPANVDSVNGDLVRTVLSAAPLRVAALLAALSAIAAPSAVARGPYREYVVAGSGGIRSSGDGGAAIQAGLRAPGAVAALPDGGFLVAEPGRIRRVSPSGRIDTVAGGPHLGFGGDGGPARAARLDNRLTSDDGLGGLAVLPGGVFLFADTRNHRVRRVGADGTVTTVAGNGSAMPIGDGGPAAQAGLEEPTDIAIAPDGGYVIADGFRVRRVWPDGRITTVAGMLPGTCCSSRWEPAVGLRATELEMRPRSVAVTPGGDLLIADINHSGTVERVGPDGTVAAVYKPPCRGSCRGEFGDARLVAATDAGFYMTLATQVLRVDRSGHTTHVAGGGYEGPFGEFFGGPPRAGAAAATDVDLTRDGGLLYVGGEEVPFAADALTVASFSLGQVHFVASPDTTRLAVAIARQTLPVLAHSQLIYRSTASARIDVSLMRRGHRMLEVTARARRGLNRIRIPRRVTPGRYYVTLIAHGRDGQTSGDRHEVLLGGVLPKDVAQALACPPLCRLLTGNAPARAADEAPYDDYSIRGCRRFTARRVDCVVQDIVEGTDSGGDEFCKVVAVTLERDGHLYRGAYGLVTDLCPARPRIARMFEPHPSHWSEPRSRADPSPLLTDLVAPRRKR